MRNGARRSSSAPFHVRAGCARVYGRSSGKESKMGKHGRNPPLVQPRSENENLVRLDIEAQCPAFCYALSSAPLRPFPHICRKTTCDLEFRWWNAAFIRIRQGASDVSSAVCRRLLNARNQTTRVNRREIARVLTFDQSTDGRPPAPGCRNRGTVSRGMYGPRSPRRGALPRRRTAPRRAGPKKRRAGNRAA